MAVHVLTTKTELFMSPSRVLHAVPQDSGICMECGETGEYIRDTCTKMGTLLPSQNPQDPGVIVL
jgi:hypothetical protein